MASNGINARNVSACPSNDLVAINVQNAVNMSGMALMRCLRAMDDVTRIWREAG